MGLSEERSGKINKEECLDCQLLCRRGYIASSCKAFLLNESACVSWDEKIVWRSNYIGTRFFSGMNHHVALKGRGCWGRAITTCASNRLLTTLNQNMILVYDLCSCIGLVVSERPFSVIQKLLGMVCKVVCLHIHVFSSQESFRWWLLRSK